MIIDRLTAKDIVAGVEIFDLKVGVYEEKAFNLLGQYEDTGLTPAEVAELAQAKENGLLLVLPCKLGRTVYIIDKGEIQRCITDRPISHDGVLAIGVNAAAGYGVYEDNVGKTVFLNKAEAQAALDRMEGQG